MVDLAPSGPDCGRWFRPLILLEFRTGQGIAGCENN